jgi:hypothetical protein
VRLFVLCGGARVSCPVLEGKRATVRAALRKRTSETRRTYERILFQLADQVGSRKHPAEVTAGECRRFPRAGTTPRQRLSLSMSLASSASSSSLATRAAWRRARWSESTDRGSCRLRSAMSSRSRMTRGRSHVLGLRGLAGASDDRGSCLPRDIVPGPEYHGVRCKRAVPYQRVASSSRDPGETPAHGRSALIRDATTGLTRNEGVPGSSPGVGVLQPGRRTAAGGPRASVRVPARSEERHRRARLHAAARR